MRRLKTIIVVFCIWFIISMTGCTRDQSPVRSSIPANVTVSINSSIPTSVSANLSGDIPTNVSVNTDWGGSMCEANGFTFFISALDSKEQLIRMNQDGSSPTVVIDENDYYIYGLTADSNNVYFEAIPKSGGSDTLYSLPINGGKAQKVTEGQIMNLQYVKGKLYWEDVNDSERTRQIKCINPDGSNLQTVRAFTASELHEGHFEFLVTEEGIYYSLDPDIEHSDIYLMDLSGENTLKINDGPLGVINLFFYDQGKLYFLMENDFSVDPLSNSMATIDQEGKAIKIINHIGYFHQDFGSILYCGISNGILYYFGNLKSSDGSSKQLLTDFHQYDLSSDKDTILLENVDMGDTAVGKTTSLRGKSFEGHSAGLYILGNDIYYSPAGQV